MSFTISSYPFSFAIAPTAARVARR
jgi:hypothetical protein